MTLGVGLLAKHFCDPTTHADIWPRWMLTHSVFVAAKFLSEYEQMLILS